MASFPSFLWQFFQYQSSLPRQPQPQFGRIFGSNNHGSVVYLTEEEATGQTFLILAFISGFLSTIIIVPKPYVPGKGFEHDLANPTRNQYRVLMISVAIYLAIIIYAGQRIVAFAVSHGLGATWLA